MVCYEILMMDFMLIAKLKLAFYARGWQGVEAASGCAGASCAAGDPNGRQSLIFDIVTWPMIGNSVTSEWLRRPMIGTSPTGARLGDGCMPSRSCAAAGRLDPSHSYTHIHERTWTASLVSGCNG
jgi:hypothetical protein